MRDRSSTGWPRIDLTERRQERWISRTSRSSSVPGVGKERALGLSQEKLAERTTLHWSYIGQVERGQRNLSLHNILRIAHALDTDAGGLVSGLEV